MTRPRIFQTTLFVASLFSVLLGIWAVSRGAYTFTNSDELMPFAVAQDVLTGGAHGAWRGAHVSEVIVIGITMLARAVTSNWYASTILYFVSFIAALWLVLARLIRSLDFAKMDAILMAAAGIVWILAMACRTPPLQRALFYPGIHADAIIAILAIMPVVLSEAFHQVVWKEKKWRFLAAVLGLCASSDTIFLAQGLLPLFLTAFLLFLLGLETRGRALFLYGFEILAWFGAIMALLVHGLHLRMTEGGDTDVRILVPLIKAGWTNFETYLAHGLFIDHGPFAVAILATPALLAIIFLQNRINGKHSIFSIFCLSCLFLTILAPMLMGFFERAAIYRYMLPAVLLPGLLMGVSLTLVLQTWIATNRPEMQSSLPCAIGAIMMVVADIGYSVIGPDKNIQQAPRQEAADYLQGVGLDGTRVGFSQYWDAKELAVLGGSHVQINALGLDGGFQWSLSSVNWLFDKDTNALPRQFFVAVTHAPEFADFRNMTIRVFGQPDSVTALSGYEIFLYRPGERAWKGMATVAQSVAQQVFGAEAEEWLPYRRKVDILPAMAWRGMAIANDRLVANGPDAALFGPYFSLLAGRYQADYTVEAPAGQRCDGEVLVSSDFGRSIHLKQPFSVVGRAEVGTTFDVPKTAVPWEFPLVMPNCPGFAVTGVSLRRV